MKVQFKHKCTKLLLGIAIICCKKHLDLHTLFKNKNDTIDIVLQCCEDTVIFS